jgi:formate hydrogenlyase subunit 3/multisubunit Na+/H+ antiporter MnhD subunit
MQDSTKNAAAVPLISMVAAVVLVVVFGYALANVSMRLQRHITARSHWDTDQGRLRMDYGRLVQAAAAQDTLAYGLLQPVAQDDLTALRADSAAMHPGGVLQRTGFLDQASACLPGTATAFAAQTPQAREACHELLALK